MSSIEHRRIRVGQIAQIEDIVWEEAQGVQFIVAQQVGYPVRI